MPPSFAFYTIIDVDLLLYINDLFRNSDCFDLKQGLKK